jgi:hypothetical protein
MNQMSLERIKRLYRKPVVTFLRIDTAEDELIISQHFLNSTKATPADFALQTGNNLSEYKGCYMEIGGDMAPLGPVMPGPVFPILAFKRSNRGNFIAQRLKLDGLYYHTKKYAWVQVGLWEKVVGDEYFFETKILMQPPKKKDKLNERVKKDKS